MTATPAPGGNGAPAAATDLGSLLWRAVIGATESRPVVFSDAASLFGGDATMSPARFDAAAADQSLSAAGMSDAVDRQMHVVALRRAVERSALKAAA